MTELYQFPIWNPGHSDDEGDYKFLTREQYNKETGAFPNKMFGDTLVFKKENDEDISGS